MRGIGYGVQDLLAAIKKILVSDREWKLGIVGLGNMGMALVRHEKARHRAFELLAELGRPAVEPLIEMLGNSDFRIRRAATNALTFIGQSSVCALMKLSSGTDRFLANTANGILRRIEAHAAEPPNPKTS